MRTMDLIQRITSNFTESANLKLEVMDNSPLPSRPQPNACCSA